MRRFEFVEGSSAKFWSAAVEGVNFIVVYGRLGTPGQRKEKAFPSDEAARKEYDKKVAEKIREGYHEVAADAGEHAPSGAKGAAAASAKLSLPVRGKTREITDESVRAASQALLDVESALGGRSWKVARKVESARRALRAIGTVDPARHPMLNMPFETLMKRVNAPKSRERFALRHALSMLALLDVAAFERALTLWASADNAGPAKVALSMLAHEHKALEEPELALRIGAILAARSDRGTVGERGLKFRWRSVQPHLESFLIGKGQRVKGHLDAIVSKGDAALTARIAAARAA